jgi:hypothetical protein
MSQMFQQALWISGTDQEDEGQEVDLLKSMTGAGLERDSAPPHFPISGSVLKSGSSGAEQSECTRRNAQPFDGGLTCVDFGL